MNGDDYRIRCRDCKFLGADSRKGPICTVSGHERFTMIGKAYELTPAGTQLRYPPNMGTDTERLRNCRCFRSRT